MTAPAATAPQTGGDLLVATGCTKTFGGLVAVSDVDFTIPTGSIVSLIGPNGAGKTTFFNMITGLYVPTEGTIRFDGRDITGG
jgi:branched-chain amino acid transport system ATP-binding protein